MEKLMNELIEIVEEANRYFVHYDSGSDSFYAQDDAFKGAKKLEDEGWKILDIYYQVDENDAEGLNKEYQDFKRRIRS